MSGTRVRAARGADVPALRTLVADAFAPFTARTGARSAPPVDWETVVWALAAVVATRDDRVVGVLVLWPHPDHVLVEILAVAPEEQGRGVGAALLDRAELTAIESGTNIVRLQTDARMTEALAHWVRRGYAEVGRRPLDGVDRVLLEKRLG
jgi:GNAT superfamily N-acetyltransferase